MSLSHEVGGFLGSWPRRWSFAGRVRAASGIYGRFYIGRNRVAFRASLFTRWFFPSLELQPAEVERVDDLGWLGVRFVLSESIGGGAIYFQTLSAEKRRKFVRALIEAGFRRGDE